MVTVNILDAKGLPIEITLTDTTFIKPSTRRFEIVELSSIDKSSAQVPWLFNQTWRYSYLRHKRVRFDNGSEFKIIIIPFLKDFAGGT